MPEGSKDSPHGKGRYGSPDQRDILGGINVPDHNKKHSEMTGSGMFDMPETSAPNLTEPITPTQTELLPRKLKFKRGTRLYKVVRDSEGKPTIPYTPVQEDDLFDRELTVPTYLDVPVEFLEIGKRGRTITRKVGKSGYGAFTVVLSPVRLSSGKVVLEERLASYLTRSSQKQI